MSNVARRLDGTEVPYAAFKRERVADFLDAALPSWLTATGTATFGNAGLTVSTTAVNGNTASIQPTFSLPWTSTHPQELSITVEGLYLDNDTANFDVGLGLVDNTNKYGAILNQVVADTTMKFQYWATTGSGSLTNVAMNYRIRGGSEAPRHRNLTFKIRNLSKELIVMENDQVMGYAKLGSLSAGGNITPSLYLTTRTAAIRSFTVGQVKIAVSSY